ncbi:MAG: hypothetical protein JWN74_498 [Acidobacteriaceae bacterium]|nr:hypothetical protein [Acidobacteriaceae bacterium]
MCAVISVLLTVFLVWQGANKPTIPWFQLSLICSVMLAAVVTAALNYKSVKLRGNQANQAEPKVFVVSSGQTAWMSGTQVTVQLHFISTHAGELVFTRVQLGGLANVGGAWQLDIEDGDPTRIGVLEQDTKILAKKFSQEELKNINLGHGTSIRGYAKIRLDGEQLARQVQINLNL